MYVVYFITYNNNFSHTHTSNSVSSSFKTCPESEYFLSLLKPRPGSQHHLTDLGHCHGLLTGLSTSQPCSSLCCPSSQRNPALHCTDGTVMGEATRHRWCQGQAVACSQHAGDLVLCTVWSHPGWARECGNGECLCIPAFPFPAGLQVF